MAAKRAQLTVLLQELAEDDVLSQVQRNHATALGLVNAVSGAAAVAISSSNDPVRIEGYVPEVVSMYSDVEFKSHFRMDRSSFEDLCTALAPLLTRERSVKLETRMLATLWMLGNLESYRSVADRFGMSKGTLHLTVMTTSRALSTLAEDYIKFPQTRQGMEKVAEGFHVRCGMPGVVGAIDGTYIRIPGPVDKHRSSYINRKGFASIQLQVVCDSDLRFLDVFTGWPGSVHDARVFRNSPVYNKVLNLPHDFHVLGDSAYPLSKGLLVPYRDNGHLDRLQKRFNKAHSSTRVDVERSIGLLKCKFRRLKYLDMILKDEIPEVVNACCMLHNFILDRDSTDLLDMEIEHDVATGPEEDENRMFIPTVQAEEKRRTIASLL